MKKVFVWSLLTIVVVFSFLVISDTYLVRKQIIIGELNDYVDTFLLAKGRNSDVLFCKGSFSVRIDKKRQVQKFSLTTLNNHSVELIKYRYKDKAYAERFINVVDEDRYYDLELMDVENLIIKLYDDLSLDEQVSYGELLRINLTVQLTKDFEFDAEDNFDKVTYIYNSTDDQLRLLNDGDLVKKGAVKITVSKDDEGNHFRERIMAVFAYF